MSGEIVTYREHMASDRWQAIRATAHKRSQGLCELCKCAARETHHIKYPRGYANDTAENVLHVCSACHRRLHGMSELISDRQLSRHHMENFKGRPAAVWVDHCGWLWASLGEWGQVLLMPASLRPRLFSDASMRARVLKEKRGEPFELCDEKGDKWYRWAAVNDGLLAWYFRTDVRRQARDDRLNDDEHDLFANVDGIRAWGDAVQEKALSGAMRIATDKAPALSNSAALAQVMGTVAGIVQDHEARLLTVEQKVHRDPVEFIDAMSFVLESGLAPNKCIPGTRQTLQAWLGVKLSASGAPRGPRVGTRLDGCSQFTEVNTYRRCDLQAMLDSVPKA